MRKRTVAVVLCALTVPLPACGGPGGADRPAGANPASTSTQTSGCATDVVTRPAGDGFAHLAAVRLSPHGSYDRLVFEFTDHIPGYTVGCRPLPIHADPSGQEILLPGATSAIYLAFSPATAAGWTDGPRTYFGPDTVSADTTVVTEAKAAGDFEAVLNWVVGLRTTAPFAVSTLDGPPRVVIDVQHSEHD